MASAVYHWGKGRWDSGSMRIHNDPNMYTKMPVVLTLMLFYLCLLQVITRAIVPTTLRSLPSNNCLSRLLRKFYLKDQMLIAIPIELVTCQGSISSVHEADKRKALRPTCLTILRKEDSCDSAHSLEDVS